MSTDSILKAKTLYLEAFIIFVEVWGNNNLGTCEIDYLEIMKYVESIKFKANEGWDLKTLDEAFKIIEDDIIDGLPVWRFLKTSQYVQDICEKNFKQELDDFKESYLCYSCKFYKQRTVMIGILEKCTYNDSLDFRHRSFSYNDRCGFEPKKECEYYEKQIKE